jgi:hypothetical protein
VTAHGVYHQNSSTTDNDQARAREKETLKKQTRRNEKIASASICLLAMITFVLLQARSDADVAAFQDAAHYAIQA